MSTTFAQGIRAALTLPDMCEAGASNTLRCPVYVDGVLTEPTSGTVTIYDATGAVVVNQQSVSKAGDSAYYAWATPATAIKGTGWRVQWDLVMPGDGFSAGAFKFENEAMVVRKRLTCPVTTQLLWLTSPGLNPGGSQPITALTAAEQDYMIEIAWIKTQGRLLAQDRKPYMIIASHGLFEFVEQSALALIFGAMAQRLNESYAVIAEGHRVNAENAWKRVRFEYDTSDTGSASADGASRKASRPAQIWLGRGSDYSRFLP